MNYDHVLDADVQWSVYRYVEVCGRRPVTPVITRPTSAGNHQGSHITPSRGRGEKGAARGVEGVRGGGGGVRNEAGVKRQVEWHLPETDTFSAFRSINMYDLCMTYASDVILYGQ